MVPGPYRDEFQAKLAPLQTMAPSVAFKDMRYSAVGSHALHKGRYRLTDVAKNAAGKSSAPVSVSFTIA